MDKDEEKKEAEGKEIEKKDVSRIGVEDMKNSFTIKETKFRGLPSIVALVSVAVAAILAIIVMVIAIFALRKPDNSSKNFENPSVMQERILNGR